MASPMATVSRPLAAVRPKVENRAATGTPSFFRVLSNKGINVFVASAVSHQHPGQGTDLAGLAVIAGGFEPANTCPAGIGDLP